MCQYVKGRLAVEFSSFYLFLPYNIFEQYDSLNCGCGTLEALFANSNIYYYVI